MRALLLCCFCLALPPISQAQGSDCKVYENDQNDRFVLHPRSFIDGFVCPGGGNCPNEIFEIKPWKTENRAPNHPSNVLGGPNFRRRGDLRPGEALYTLGCGGQAIFEFLDNSLVDVPGDDILVFEAGKTRSPVELEISENGFSWRSVGVTDGGKGSLDIAKVAKRGERFKFVRVTDASRKCDTAKRFAGADIDAIAAMAFSWTHVHDDTQHVLFEFGSAELTATANAVLETTFHSLGSLSGYRLEIAGHTDSIGAEGDNLSLSLRR